MREPPLSRPLHEPHFQDDLRLHAAQSRHVLGGDAFAPMAGLAAGEVCEGALRLLKRLQYREEFCPAVRRRPRSDLAREHQLPAFVLADEE